MTLHRHARLTARVLVGCAGALILFVVLGNVAIIGVSTWAKRTAGTGRLPAVEGVANLRAVDGRVWRGAAPTATGYQSLAARGVTTVIDLRAEDGLKDEQGQARALGLTVLRIPIRDGQTPSSDDVDALLASIARSPGLVYLHCGAGVGRTGTMAAAYLVARGEAGKMTALRRNLAVGPPSLEQLAFVVRLGGGETSKPGTVITAASRVLDAPRRLWSRIG